jgi:rubrerythrin
MVSGGGTPNLEYNEPDMSTKTTDMLKADIMVEKETVLKYDEAAKKINVTGIKELLLRIRDHEKYHTDVFSDLLKDEKKK